MPNIQSKMYITPLFLTFFISCQNQVDESTYDDRPSMMNSSLGKQEGIPLPDPVPKVIDIALIRAGWINENKKEILTIIGLSGSVQREGEVIVKNGSLEVKTCSTEKGTFIAEIQGDMGNILDIQFEDSVPVQFELGPVISIVPEPPFAIPNLPPIERITSEEVLIQGGTSAMPGKTIVLINMHNQEVVTTVVEEDQTFKAILLASPNDLIQVVNDLSRYMGPPWNLIAPE